MNLLTIKITKWGTKKTVVYNTPKRPEIIGRDARKFCGRSVGDNFCWVHQYIGADHPKRNLESPGKCHFGRRVALHKLVIARAER